MPSHNYGPQIERQIKSLALERGPFCTAGRLKDGSLAAVAARIADSFRRPVTFAEIVTVLGNIERDHPMHFRTHAETSAAQNAARFKANQPPNMPSDMTRENLAKLPPAIRLEIANGGHVPSHLEERTSDE